MSTCAPVVTIVIHLHTKVESVSIDLHMSKELLAPVGQPPLSHCRRFGGHWTFRPSGMVMLSLNM